MGWSVSGVESGRVVEWRSGGVEQWSGEEEQPAPGTTFTNSQTQPHNPKPQNLQHKSMRPWQKQEGGDGEVEEPPETDRSDRSREQEQPAPGTTSPNGQTQPHNPKPQNLQHKSMRPWQKQEGGDGDGEDEEPPETARSGGVVEWWSGRLVEW